MQPHCTGSTTAARCVASTTVARRVADSLMAAEGRRLMAADVAVSPDGNQPAIPASNLDSLDGGEQAEHGHSGSSVLSGASLDTQSMHSLTSPDGSRPATLDGSCRTSHDGNQPEILVNNLDNSLDGNLQAERGHNNSSDLFAAYQPFPS